VRAWVERERGAATSGRGYKRIAELTGIDIRVRGRRKSNTNGEALVPGACRWGRRQAQPPLQVCARIEFAGAAASRCLVESGSGDNAVKHPKSDLRSSAASADQRSVRSGSPTFGKEVRAWPVSGAWYRRAAMLAGLPQVKALSVRQKLELVDELWKAVAADLNSLEVTQDEKDLLDQRWAAFHEDPACALTPEQFKQQLSTRRA